MEASAVYQAENWQYTEDGYLMFSGRWCSDSEEQYVLTLSGTEEYSAFRVQPLDEMCRELNRKYLLPIGYEKNNMFLTDWSEDDFGELNFYHILISAVKHCRQRLLIILKIRPMNTGQEEFMRLSLRSIRIQKSQGTQRTGTERLHLWCMQYFPMQVIPE